ncbi:hypothetical protein GCM10009769_04140 [Curtobacterium luteum]|uniref:Uncharacterized protein n=1 Tax=Curtobacterium luteum TaxID=33881 RepID=A0A8H9G5V0_9MICO|nr:hypothetical protein GCM10009769_04140 [Curtobacterium luteum]
MADDDVAAERARLEALAWGADASPAEAARARIRLEDLRSGRRPRRGGSPGGPAPTRDLRRTPSTAGSPSVGPAPVPVHGPEVPSSPVGGVPRATDPVGHDRWESVEGDPADATGTAAATDGMRPDHEADAADQDGSAPGLPTGWRDRVHALLWTRRPRVWIAMGAAAAVSVAFAAGTVVGTAGPAVPAAPSITPTAGAVTLEQLLDVPQTYADQLPGPVEAPVSLHSTRLVFTNRALDGGDLETPWNVWAGVGTDRSTICLVATADRIESSTACYPREDALHGSVSLSAQSRSGTLTLWLRGGGVQGTVTDSY